MNALTAIAAGLSFVLGATLAALAWAWRLRLKSRAKAAVPQRWPLRARAIVNGNEREVWQALQVIFHDHVVLVKTPIPRFTRLRDTDKAKGRDAPGRDKSGALAQLKSEQWLEKLSSLHTTFTVCTREGKVVGCVDVPGQLALTQASRELKESLLLECGIAYTVVNAFNLPDAGVMRELFLGEVPPARQEQQATRGGDSEFHADLAAFTKGVQPAR